jgi:hypothetical protein
VGRAARKGHPYPISANDRDAAGSPGALDYGPINARP